MRLLPACLLACLPATAHASAVVIWPVDPVIRTAEKATALWLENKGTTPVTLQVRTFAWSQPQGDDRLDPQDRVVASPPIATVPPGARQLVRLIRRTADAVPESAYRLLIDELPAPPPTGPDGPPQARLAVQMRYSIPLFAFTSDASAARLDARIVAGAQGRTLVIRNVGQAHARLTDLRIVSAGRETMLHAGLAGYVLAGATRSIPLDGGATGLVRFGVRVGVNGVDQTLGTST